MSSSGYSPQCDNAVLAASDAHYLQKTYSPSALSWLMREILDEAKVQRHIIECGNWGGGHDEKLSISTFL